MKDPKIVAAFDPVRPEAALREDIVNMAKNPDRAGKARPLRYRVAAVAAMLAILLTAALWPRQTENGIITAPGVLKVYAGEMDAEMGEHAQLVELPQDDAFWVAIWHPLINAGNFGQSFVLEVPDDYFGDAKVTMQVSSTYQNVCEKKMLNNGDAFSLRNTADFRGEMMDLWNEMGEDGSFFVDIIIYADGKVAGYGIVSFCFSDLTCYACKFTTVCFPIVEGKLQNVSEEYVWKQIEEYKKEANTSKRK